jgi:hypothetical protein
MRIEMAATACIYLYRFSPGLFNTLSIGLGLLIAFYHIYLSGIFQRCYQSFQHGCFSLNQGTYNIKDFNFSGFKETLYSFLP